MCAIACQSATMLVQCSNVTVSVKKCTCASVRLEWSLDQLGHHISIVIIIIIIIIPEIPDRGETSETPGLPSGDKRRQIRTLSMWTRLHSKRISSIVCMGWCIHEPMYAHIHISFMCVCGGEGGLLK